jgi:hypothetical protein
LTLAPEAGAQCVNAHAGICAGAAREGGPYRDMYADGLLLLFEMADREDERFPLAAARWHARFVLEAGLPLREAEGVMTLLCRLREADRHVVRRRLLLAVERAGLTTREIRSQA